MKRIESIDHSIFSGISQLIQNINLGIINSSFFWIMILPFWYYFRRLFFVLSALSLWTVCINPRKVFNRFIDRIFYWLTELKPPLREQNCGKQYISKSIVITTVLVTDQVGMRRSSLQPFSYLSNYIFSRFEEFF